MKNTRLFALRNTLACGLLAAAIPITSHATDSGLHLHGLTDAHFPGWNYPHLWSEKWPGTDFQIPLWLQAYSLPAGRKLHYCEGEHFIGPCSVATADGNMQAFDFPEVGSLEVLPVNFDGFWTLSEAKPTWPHTAKPGYHDPHIQGLAHGLGSDGNYYHYFSNAERIVKIPAGADLNGPGIVAPFDNPFACDVTRGGCFNHIGDIDFYDGKVFAILEDGDSGDKPPRIAVFDEDLNPLFYRDVPSNDIQDKGGWVAVNPVNGLVYSTSGDAEIRVYDPRLDYQGNSDLEYLYSIMLTPSMGNIGNGGAFSEKGDLYVTREASGGDGFIYQYKLLGNTGSLAQTIQFSVEWGEDVQGIDIWPTDFAWGINPSYQGDIHVTTSQWLPFVTMNVRHWAVDDPSEL